MGLSSRRGQYEGAKSTVGPIRFNDLDLLRADNVVRVSWAHHRGVVNMRVAILALALLGACEMERSEWDRPRPPNTIYCYSGSLEIGFYDHYSGFEDKIIIHMADVDYVDLNQGVVTIYGEGVPLISFLSWDSARAWIITSNCFRVYGG